MSTPMRGVYTIPSTPFDEQGQLDEEGLRGIVDFCVECGAHGIVWPVNASEFTILSDQERLEGSRTGADTLQRMTVTGKISTAPMRGVSSWPGMGPSLWTLADAGPSRLVALSKGGQCLALVVS